MTFNKISQYTFYCDNCPAIIVHDGWRKSDAIKEAREFGWKIGKKHYCPKCQKGKSHNHGGNVE